MKKLILLSLFLTTPAYAAITNVDVLQGGLKPDVVWPQGQDAQKKCMSAQTQDGYMACLLKAMQKDKASDQAIALAKITRGSVEAFKTFGNLSVAKLAVPGADYSEAYYIVNNMGDFINVDDHSILSTIDIKQAPNYQTIAQKYPNISIWPGNHQYPAFVILPGGVQQLQFNYSLLNGCHACELAGIAKVGFNFDSDGHFMNAQLLGLSPPPVTTS